MSHRFFVDSLEPGEAVISGSEAHHLAHVLRLRAGDRVELLDGTGRVADAVLKSIGRREAIAAVESIREVPRPARAAVTVAAAPPKGERLRWMIEKLTEIGVDRYIPLLTARATVVPRETRLERLQATIRGACKQSGRARLLQVAEPRRVADVIAGAPDAALLLAQPNAAPCGEQPRCESAQTLLVGPEGGFTDDELRAIQDAGAARITWPGTILRIETAAVVLSAVLLSRAAMAPQDSD